MFAIFCIFEFVILGTFLQVLIEENGNLRREIQRLKQDNATLIKKTKHAMTDKDEIVVCFGSLTKWI